MRFLDDGKYSSQSLRKETSFCPKKDFDTQETDTDLLNHGQIYPAGNTFSKLTMKNTLLKVAVITSE